MSQKEEDKAAQTSEVGFMKPTRIHENDNLQASPATHPVSGHANTYILIPSLIGLLGIRILMPIFAATQQIVSHNQVQEKRTLSRKNRPLHFTIASSNETTRPGFMTRWQACKRASRRGRIFHKRSYSGCVLGTFGASLALFTARTFHLMACQRSLLITDA